MNKRLNFGGDPDLDCDTGKMCFGGGMHCPSASSYYYHHHQPRQSTHSTDTNQWPGLFLSYPAPDSRGRGVGPSTLALRCQ